MMNTIAGAMTLDPIIVDPKSSVRRAAQLMEEFNIGALVVSDGWQVLGIVTDRDIAVRAIAAGLDPLTTEVAHVMSESVRCCRPDETTAAALNRMAASQIRRLVVVDPLQRLMGIVTLGDLAARRVAGVDEALARICTPVGPDRDGDSAAAPASETQRKLRQDLPPEAHAGVLSVGRIRHPA